MWIDANGRTRQTIIKTLTGAATIQANVANCSNSVQHNAWESFQAGGVGVPVAANMQSVADAASMMFQTGPGGILRLTVPAPKIGIFMPDGVTVNPADFRVVALVAACIGLLSDGAGNAAALYLGGRYSRGSRTDLDTP